MASCRQPDDEPSLVELSTGPVASPSIQSSSPASLFWHPNSDLSSADETIASDADPPRDAQNQSLQLPSVSKQGRIVSRAQKARHREVSEIPHSDQMQAQWFGLGMNYQHTSARDPTGHSPEPVAIESDEKNPRTAVVSLFAGGIGGLRLKFPANRRETTTESLSDSPKGDAGTQPMVLTPGVKRDIEKSAELHFQQTTVAPNTPFIGKPSSVTSAAIFTPTKQKQQRTETAVGPFSVCNRPETLPAIKGSPEDEQLPLGHVKKHLDASTTPTNARLDYQPPCRWSTRPSSVVLPNDEVGQNNTPRNTRRRSSSDLGQAIPRDSQPTFKLQSPPLARTLPFVKNTPISFDEFAMGLLAAPSDAMSTPVRTSIPLQLDSRRSPTSPTSVMFIPRRRRTPASPSAISTLSNISLRGRRSAADVFVEFPPVGTSQPTQSHVDTAILPREPSHTARLMFWVGFIAPWCWLLGGWLHGQLGDDKRTILPLHPSISYVQHSHRRSSRYSQGTPTPVSTCQRSVVDPRLAGSDECLLREPSKVTHSTLHAQKKLQSYMCQVLQCADPWVRRCRIAAIVSAILIFCAVLIGVLVACHGGKFH
ncbi:hypothetical protein BKA62DRAFT_667998 [Auriculariales sp. MPI-PUGE-AT-0066]|nr:hypothetical protein BKA62DRAFT_667998 [Auriculariales sp. MPI-PUGE-AT-0066]